jgi:hypothetical protein
MLYLTMANDKWPLGSKYTATTSSSGRLSVDQVCIDWKSGLAMTLRRFVRNAGMVTLFWDPIFGHLCTTCLLGRVSKFRIVEISNLK